MEQKYDMNTLAHEWSNMFFRSTHLVLAMAFMVSVSSVSSVFKHLSSRVYMLDAALGNVWALSSSRRVFCSWDQSQNARAIPERKGEKWCYSILNLNLVHALFYSQDKNNWILTVVFVPFEQLIESAKRRTAVEMVAFDHYHFSDVVQSVDDDTRYWSQV